MSRLGRILSFYPAFILSLAMATLIWFGYRPSPVQPVAFIFILYLLPPLTLRLHQLIFPLREGLSKLSEPGYSPWWGTHQIQLLYIALPMLARAQAKARTQAREGKSVLSRILSAVGAPSRREPDYVCGDLTRLPFGTAAFDLAWSNLALQWATEASKACQGKVEVRPFQVEPA